MCSVIGIIFSYVVYCFLDAYKTIKIKNEIITYVKMLLWADNKNISNIRIEIAFWVFLVEGTVKNTLNLLLFAIILILLIIK